MINSRSFLAPLSAAGAVLLLSACQTAPTYVPAPPATPEMIDSAALVLDDTCQVDGAVLVEYTVRRSGQTGNVQISSAPDCAREALSAWVSSYRYVPQPADIATRFEWILVSGRRGS